MADPRGFLNHREREIPPNRPVDVRLLDWKYVKDELAKDPDVLTRQASRKADFAGENVGVRGNQKNIVEGQSLLKNTHELRP